MVNTKEQKCPEEGAVELSSAGEVFAVYKCEDHSSDLQNPGQSHVGRAVSINPSTRKEWVKQLSVNPRT